MKKTFTSLLFTISALAFSQYSISTTKSTSDLLNGILVDTFVSSKTSGVLKYDEIKGSPYTTDFFHEAKIAENYKNVEVRYNSYKDEVEFKSDKSIMVIPKEEKFRRIEIIATKEILVYANLDGMSDHYYFELVNGKVSLYKKIETKFTDLEKASTPFGSDKPATFNTISPVFYITDNNKTLANPKKERDFMEFFPDKKDALKNFFKQNKIKFNNDADLVKIVKFLNQ